MDRAERISGERDGHANAPLGAESRGEGWAVYPHREKGRLVAHVLAVNLAPGVRKKTRIPPAYDTADLRARFATGAAAAEREIYTDSVAAKTAEQKTGAVTSPTALTFKEIAELWTSGGLAKNHPDHVEAKLTAEIDVSRLKVINEIVGTVPITDAGWIDHAGRVMRGLPKRVKTTATRRHYAAASLRSRCGRSV
jgi:hypothetical protein